MKIRLESDKHLKCLWKIHLMVDSISVNCDTDKTPSEHAEDRRKSFVWEKRRIKCLNIVHCV